MEEQGRKLDAGQLPDGDRRQGSSGVGVSSPDERRLDVRGCRVLAHEQAEVHEDEERVGQLRAPRLAADQCGCEGHQETKRFRRATRCTSSIRPRKTGRSFAYPICTFTYVILPKKTDKAAMFKRFVNYAINPTQGQKFETPPALAPSPREGSGGGGEDAQAGAILDRQLLRERSRRRASHEWGPRFASSVRRERQCSEDRLRSARPGAQRRVRTAGS